MFHSKDGLYFTRNEDGSVTILKTDGKPIVDGGTVLFDQTLDSGTWVSACLSMSAFNERPGDFYVWERHHSGKEDVLAGQHIENLLFLANQGFLVISDAKQFGRIIEELLAWAGFNRGTAIAEDVMPRFHEIVDKLILLANSKGTAPVPKKSMSGLIEGRSVHYVNPSGNTTPDAKHEASVIINIFDHVAGYVSLRNLVDLQTYATTYSENKLPGTWHWIEKEN